MRLTRIGFGGFRRLADTSCNVDGRLVAFLGPNEAGKSSVLAGLAWLADEDDNAALESSLRSRSIPAFGVGRKVVTAEFVLDDEDRAALAGLDSDVVPRLLRISRTAGGTRLWETVPVLTRRPGPTEEAAAALREVVGRLGAAMARPHGQEAPADLADTVLAALGEPDRVPTPEVTSAFEELNAWLRMPFTSTPEGDAEPVETPPDRRDVACADLLDAATARLASESPGFHATEVLRHRVPDFLLFGEDDRVLLSQYNLADRALRSAVPAALTNLLAVGGTTVAEVIRARDADTARVRTLERRTNDRLRERLQPTWRQSTLAVRIALDGDLLQILVDELGPDGETTPIAERSDGVRAFLALVCFLADKERDSDIQPILMIDEAETHLHYDAQADLLEVLLRHVKASKVLYTTHSPGCLPPDLGTGVRLVARDPERPGASQLKSDFWRSDEPGFNPLLFAMGAGAAAFSVCRAAASLRARPT